MAVCRKHESHNDTGCIPCAIEKMTKAILGKLDELKLEQKRGFVARIINYFTKG